MKYKLIIISFLCALCAYGQRSERIVVSVDAPSHKGQKVFLASYLDGKPYAVDSAFIDKEGKATLENGWNLLKGQYLLYIQPDKQYDLLFSGTETNVSIKVNKDETRTRISGSPDSELLWAYLIKRQEKDDRIEQLQNKIVSEANLSDAKRQTLVSEIKALEKDLNALTASETEKHSGTWYATYLKALDPVVPPMEASQTPADFFAYREYMREHFFDNFDLTEPAYWRTNYMSTMLDTYMNSFVDDIPDAKADAASLLVSKTMGNDYCFKRMLSRFINEAQTSNLVGMENVWVRLYEDYIRDKEVDWIGDIERKGLEKQYQTVLYSRVGMVARNLDLEGVAGEPISSNAIDAKYTLLYFYDLECSRCKEDLPFLYDKIYSQYKGQGLNVLAIHVGENHDGWKGFVETHDFKDWVNASDPGYKTEFWKYYDMDGIPAMFLLNKKKIIIAKHMDKDGLKMVLDELFER